MPYSPSSSAQAAREAVARRLGNLRKSAGLTGSELAERCGWHHSKTSRIENARTTPSARDVGLWCGACGAAEEADDLVAQSLAAESMYSEWRHQVRAGLKVLQDSWAQFFRDTQFFRVYSSTLVPGLLQTEGYAAALLTEIGRFRKLPVNDGAEAAAARVQRSQVMHEPGHRFLILIEEAVLHYRLGSEDVMAAQLRYLLTAGALPAVSLGVIPAAITRRHWPHETFHVYDDSLVSVELISAQMNIVQSAEVIQYVKAFDEMRAMAVYGAGARALIVCAIEALR